MILVSLDMSVTVKDIPGVTNANVSITRFTFSSSTSSFDDEASDQ
jgi:hypothetical protein